MEGNPFVAFRIRYQCVLRGKYILMQKLLLAVVVLINLRYMVFGVAPAIAWITNVADIFNYLFISQSTNCEEVPTLATLPSNENSLLSMYLWLAENDSLTFQNSVFWPKNDFVGSI